MANEKETAGKREEGRRLAIEGILRSRFGERPCKAARRALRELRSGSDALGDSTTRPGAPANGARGKARRKRRERVPASVSGSPWPRRVTAGLATAAALLLLLTGWLVWWKGQSDPKRRGGPRTQPIAKQREAGPPKGARKIGAGGQPSGKDARPSRDERRDFARVLGWTQSIGKRKTGFGNAGPKIKYGAEPTPDPNMVLGGPPRVGSRGGSRGGQHGTGIGKGSPPERIGSPGPDAGSPRIKAEIKACLQRLSFRARIPERLPGSHRLVALEMRKRNDGVALSYAKGKTTVRVFLSSSAGRDTPFAEVGVGKRLLRVARKRNLLIAIENAPAGFESWAGLFASP